MKAAPLVMLEALIKGCATSSVLRQALLLRTDRLPPSLSRPHHLRLAEAALAPLLAVSHAQMFHLPGPRYAVTWRGDADMVLMDVIQSLHRLLEDAPPQTPTLQDLVFLFDLPEQGALLQAAIDETASEAAPAPRSGAAKPLSVVELGSLESSLAHAELSRFVRRRQIWRTGFGKPKLAWEKRTLSVVELAATLLPGSDIQLDEWLFRRLTRTLDRRMLSLLSHAGELTGAGPFSLDLNVQSLLGPEFLRFDAALPAPLRNHVIIEVTAADIMADPAAFAFARNFARVRGYALMLRGVTQAMARLMSLPSLAFDYLQCPWSRELAAAGLPPGCPADRTMLAGVTDAAAIAWGRANGIQLFQGRGAVEATLGEPVAAA